MKLKNILITVNDLETSIAFYKNLFGLEVIANNGQTVILTEGLVLQDAKIWQAALGQAMIPKHNSCELYFEDTDAEAFAEKLEGTHSICHQIDNTKLGAKNHPLLRSGRAFN